MPRLRATNDIILSLAPSFTYDTTNTATDHLPLLCCPAELQKVIPKASSLTITQEDC